jgi:hypothetical protein
VQVVVDVRAEAWSKSAPCYRKEALETALPAASMIYIHAEELGNPLAAECKAAGSLDPYRAYLAEHPRALARLLILLNAKYTVALLCGCRRVDQCHRGVIAQAVRLQLLPKGSDHASEEPLRSLRPAAHPDGILRPVRMPEGGAGTAPATAPGAYSAPAAAPSASIEAPRDHAGDALAADPAFAPLTIRHLHPPMGDDRPPARIYGVTLHQPWAWGKLPPPLHMMAIAIGTYLALHAGKTYDSAAGIQMVNRGLRPPGPKEHDHGIVAVCRKGEGGQLEQVTPIEPVPCRGAAGLWRLPDDVLLLVRERWLARKR